MDMTITVDVRNSYGTFLIYPVCDKAKLFAAIAGTKTIGWNALPHIKALGYTVVDKGNEARVL